MCFHSCSRSFPLVSLSIVPTPQPRLQACSSALIAQSVAQTDAWASIAAAASLSAPTYNTAVRLAVGALLLGNSLFGLVAGLIEMREAVTAVRREKGALLFFRFGFGFCGRIAEMHAKGKPFCREKT